MRWRWLFLVQALMLLLPLVRGSAATADVASPPAPASAAPTPVPPARVPPSWVHPQIGNASATVTLSSYRASIVAMALRSEHPLKMPKWRSQDETGDPRQPLEVLDHFNPTFDMNNFIEGMELPADPGREGSWDWHQLSDQAGYFTLEREGMTYRMTYRMDIVKPQVHVQLLIANGRSQPVALLPRLRAIDGIHQDDPTIEASFVKVAAHFGGPTGSLTTYGFPDTEVSTAVAKGDHLDYIALKGRFFAAWWTPEGGQLTHAGALPAPLATRVDATFVGFPQLAAAGTYRQAMLNLAYRDGAGNPFAIAPGDQLGLDWAIAISCMTKNELAKLDPMERQLEFTDAYYSFFKSIANIMTWALRAIAHVVHYYGVAVILLTFLVKALLHRFTHKQYESTMKMQKLQPELKYLQEQYKDDRQKLATKQMELWKKNGVNPLGGCLPILVQVPLFIALYQSFYHSADMRGQSFLWIRDLTLPDQLWYLGFHLPFGNQLATINPLPILYIVITIWISRLQKPPTGGDPQQEQMFKMMRWLPAIFGVIFYNMPAGLVLYFTVQAVLSAIEIKMVKRRLGMT